MAATPEPEGKSESKSGSKPGTRPASAAQKAASEADAEPKEMTHQERQAEIYKKLLELFKDADYEALRQYLGTFEINERYDVVNIQGDDGRTPIFHCLDVEQVDCLQLILDYGADPQWLTEERNSVLHEGCALGHKRALKMCIFLGADQAVENAGYHKCFQMVQGDANRLAMQNFLNTSVEQLKTALKEKEILMCTRQQRSFLRGVYDVVDESGKGFIRFQDVYPYLYTMVNNQQAAPHSEATLEWFKTFDKNKNGTVPFDEFLYCVLTHIEARDKGKKKGGKGKKKK